MNSDEPNQAERSESGLEARIVAWVVGEASAFEIAELQRILNEQPELLVFKRRIEAVQGLVAEAIRPDKARLHLSAERRAKLMETIGASPRPGPTPGQPVVMPLAAGQKKRWTLHHWALPLAACFALVATIAAFYSPFQMRQSKRLAYERPEAEKGFVDSEPQKSPVAPGKAGEPSLAENKAAYSISLPSSGMSRAQSKTLREVAKAPAQSPGAAPLSVSLPTSQTSDLPPAVSREFADETVVLSPFVVEATEDRGYTASSTLAGTRIRTELSDVGSAISVVSKDFLADTGATNSQDLLKYGANTEVGGVSGNFSGKGNFEKRDRRAFKETSPLGTGASNGYIGNEQPSLSVAPSADQGLLAGAKNELARPAPDQTVLGQNAVSLEARSSENGSDADAAGVDVSANPPSLAKKQAQLSSAPAASPVSDLKSAEPLDEDKPLPTKPAPAAPPPPVRDEQSTAKQPVSTFSLHVSDVSFRLAQAALAQGEMPDPARIRPEEFYNAFSYDDPAPAISDKISCHLEQSAHPFLQQRNFVRIAMKVPSSGRGAGQPLRLTLLLDTSGSMERDDRAASVKRAITTLVSLLGPNDRVTLIGFARQPHLLAEDVPGDKAAQLIEIVSHTPAEGGTNIEEALKLGSDLAHRYFEKGAQNRIVLLTDGAANLGNADPAQLATSVEALREQGIAFDACGVGTDGIDDTMLEALTRKGDGRYTLLNAVDSADDNFAHQLAGAFRPAAENVKVQVRFNPSRVGHYRLIGFEQHRLNEEDFRNDKVDAAELAADEAAIALYQVEVLPQGEGELGEVYVRFRDAASGTMVERSWTMAYDPQVKAFDRAPRTIQLAGSAALLAEKLQGGPVADQIRLAELAPIIANLRSEHPNEVRVQELAALYAQMRKAFGD